MFRLRMVNATTAHASAHGGRHTNMHERHVVRRHACPGGGGNLLVAQRPSLVKVARHHPAHRSHYAVGVAATATSRRWFADAPPAPPGSGEVVV